MDARSLRSTVGLQFDQVVGHRVCPRHLAGHRIGLFEEVTLAIGERIPNRQPIALGELHLVRGRRASYEPQNLLGHCPPHEKGAWRPLCGYLLSTRTPAVSLTLVAVRSQFAAVPIAVSFGEAPPVPVFQV